MADKGRPRDLVRGRGERGSSPVGTSIFVGLRLLDGFVLQRALQLWDPMPGLLSRFGITSKISPAGGLPVQILNQTLTPFQAVIWAMSIGSAVKQSIWILGVSKEPMYADGAVMISIFNTLVNSLNTLAFGLAGNNSTWSETGLYASITLYAAGILIELVAEIQRKRFKDDPKNAGKAYSGGLFAYARSINYFGYTIWRGAFALAGGGVIWGSLITAVLAWDFCNRAIPVMDEYCSKRYGEQWRAVKRRVPYAFCPGLY